MPWEHCGQFVLDDESCPACNITKAQWTVEIDKTRLFTISKKKRTKRLTAFVAFQMVDAAGRPVTGECFRLDLPDNRVVQGSLDTEGRARIEGLPPGMCRVTFSSYGPIEGGAPGAAAEVALVSTPRLPGGVVLGVPLATGSECIFRVDTLWLDVRATDALDNPLDGWSYELELSDRSHTPQASGSGVLDSRARLRREVSASADAIVRLLPPGVRERRADPTVRVGSSHVGRSPVAPAPPDVSRLESLADPSRHLRVRVTDTLGAPLEGWSYSIDLPGGQARTGLVASHGWLEELDLPAGTEPLLRVQPPA